MRFQVNEGPADRVIRLFVGVVMLNVAAVTTGPLFVFALVIGLIGVITGLTGFCLPYVLFGISTLPKDEKDRQKGAS